MPFMLNFPFQFHKPVSCVYKVGYFPFVTHTSVCVSTHSNYVNIVLFSQTKHSVSSIGATGFHESTPLSKDMVPSVDFGISEQEEYGDDDIEGREKDETSFVSSWRELEEEDDDDGIEEFDTSFVSSQRDDDGERREKFNTPFVSKMKLQLPPWGEVEDDDDDIGGRGDNDASLVARKELPPRGEVVDYGQQESRPFVTTLSASKEHGAQFLEEMDENVLSNRILELSRINKIRSAMEYFRSMELLGLCPNIHACNSLMSSLLRNGWCDDCFKVFNFAKTRGIAIGHTYSLILTARAKAQGCDSALKFFRELESECDVEKDFDAIVYNTMISICRNADNWSEIVMLWKSMQANGCAETLATYRLLISTFVHCDQSELALYAYHEMVQNGFEPNSNILNAIICVCAKEGKWEAALSTFKKMLKGELKPNLVACNALISSLGREGELKLAFQVYDKLKSLGHKPDAYTFNALLSSLNRANRHHEALQLFERIERNQNFQFNVHVYNTALMSCSKLGLWDKALEIVWQMECSGMSDMTVSYSLVIRACQLARKPTTALQVYEHMLHQKCSPTHYAKRHSL
ncbi:pentatricopeptide repeat-containing protein At3g29290 isoform X2 [Lotus japonicus]|uniref:pentatricopeptide repeat-containing protein At3g29290 isoform X2 n=1 Tax=Lotus japonicus TaxID=34305 RepID=UPI002589AF3C|nr:pentatricopeptide repeat-containing protein At3g29290 isoform X2 [Lotus japonicus]